MGGATEGPNNERRGNCMKSNGIASDNLLLQAAASPQDEFVAGHGRQPASIPPGKKPAGRRTSRRQIGTLKYNTLPV